ncbi:hypothetical protein SAMD00019534_053530, partial [Acytostelium subglobosum LB1]|uniref:hypothetical protein n=1 Tax=Acytostelium subglobosum LB1 TaxID=1410327 RepID=UPI0006448B14
CLNKLFIIFGLLLGLFYLYLYNYMFFCSWKWQMDHYSAQMVMLGDPQMEGDGRIYKEGTKGLYNLWFNDHYFKHIVSNIAYFLAPSHVVVLGDLFSSQYIHQQEFDKRVARYRTVFSPLSSETLLINITGNHDIGYANEADRHLVQRFEDAFGKVNRKWYVAGHILAIFNSMTLDPPSNDQEVYDEAWQFLNDLARERNTTNTPIILATHIPLYKELDGTSLNRTYQPNFSIPYHSNPLCIEPYEVNRISRGGKSVIRDQTMLSPETSRFILEEIQPVFIFNGHDHDGCIYKHNNTIE